MNTPKNWDKMTSIEQLTWIEEQRKAVAAKAEAEKGQIINQLLSEREQLEARLDVIKGNLQLLGYGKQGRPVMSDEEKAKAKAVRDEKKNQEKLEQAKKLLGLTESPAPSASGVNIETVPVSAQAVAA